MALTPEEQRLLDEMEAALSESDPKLVNTLRGTPALIVDRRRVLLGGLGVVAGLALLVVGMSTHWSVSVLGFLLMLVGALYGFRGLQHVDGEDHPDAPEAVVIPEREPQGRLDAWRRHHEDDEA